MDEAKPASVEIVISEASRPVPMLAPPKLGELIPTSRFNGHELAEIDAIAKGIDFTDADSILAQMNAPNQKFADAITKELENVAVSDILISPRL